jgi:3-oxoacyl-[acyl-carrier protein] reductase
MEAKQFSGQVALITGGADGLGKGIARRLATLGATIVLFDKNADLLKKTIQEFQQASLPVAGAVVDIASEGQVNEQVQKVIQQQGRIDVLVNSAGIVGPTGIPITDYPTSSFDELYAVNLRGSFLMTKAVLPVMQQHRYGRILLIASIAGKEGNPFMVGYSASKAGVIGLVKAIGKEYAESGITVNGLAPAVIKTAMNEQTSPEQLKYMTDRIPMKRLGTIEEVAALAGWIVSREASFNTGCVFDLSGGRATY